MKSLLLIPIVTLCLLSLTSYGQFSQVDKVWPPNVVEGDNFARTSRISGNTAVMGSPQNSNLTGKADVFERNLDTGEWEHVLTLDPPTLDFAGEFGFSLAIDGDIIVVAAWKSDDTSLQNGDVYVFSRNEGGDNNWGFLKKLTPVYSYAESYQTHFGFAVDISGDNIIVGAIGYDSQPNPFSVNVGAAFIFNQNQGGTNNWGFVKMLSEIDVEFEGANDVFGKSVAIDGDRCIVGSEDDINGDQSGAVWVFQQNQGGASNWGLVKKINPTDGEFADHFGVRIDLDGDVIVAGASGDDDIAPTAGAAYVFHKDEGGSDNWGEVAKLLAADGEALDNFATDVDVFEDRILVTAYNHNPNFEMAGAMYIFMQNEGGADNWGFVQKHWATTYSDINSSYGWSVDSDGATIVVGDVSDNEPFVEEWNAFSGAAYFYGMTVNGCISNDACNYDVEATEDDGSCYFAGDPCDDGDSNTVDDQYQLDCNCSGEAIVEGCTDGGACNYDSAANVDDTSCYFVGDSCDDSDEWTENDAYDINCDCTGDDIPQVFGCMDSEACNFNVQANVDDGSCEYVTLYDIVGNLATDVLVEESYVYSSTVESTYTWSVQGGAIASGQGTNGVTVIWSMAGAHDLTVFETTDDNCEGEIVTVTIQVDAVGVAILDKDEFTLYPNPTSDLLTISVGGFGPAEVVIFNAVGELIYKEQLNGKSIISVENWSPGLYTVMLTGQGKQALEILVVE